MSRVMTDLWSGVRALRRGRAVTVLAVLAFALGIGITTAVFSVFYGVLMRPLPYPDPDELVVVYGTQPTCNTCPASYPKYIDWKTRNTVFSAIGGSWTPQVVVTGLGDPERVIGAKTTASLIDVFKVAPWQGRWFTEAEDQPGGRKVAVLSYGYWVRGFGSDPRALGRTLPVDGESYEVIGIMPPGFSHRQAEFFVPLQKKLDPANRGEHFLATYARLKKGITPGRAQREMVALGRTLAVEFGHNHGIDVQPYAAVVVGNVAQPLRVLMGAVCFVLLVACANVANLLLASGLARRRELAVRSALGATRWDLVRQLTVESVVLASVGGLIGLGVAEWTIRGFVVLAGTALPRTTAIQIDGTVLGFAALLSLATGALCGLWPVLRLGTRTLAQGVRVGDLRTGSEAGGRRFGNGLVVAEIALAFSLLVGAGLLVKNLVRLEARDTGFSTDRVIAFDVAPTGARYEADEPVGNFYRQLLSKLQAIPGVVHVGVTSHLPMYNFGWNGEVTIEGGNPWKPNEAPLIEYRWIGGDYFKAIGITVTRGRAFDDRDRLGTTPVTIINERTAKKFWPDANPIGKHIQKGSKSKPLEVVGVIHDVRSYGLSRNAPYELYTPIEQSEFGPMTVVLLTQASDTAGVIPAARRAVLSVDPLVPIANVQTMDEVVGASVNQPRLISSLTSLFGALAAVLAAVGVYGVMAYNVRRERREFGIRLALGADPKRVRRVIVWRGLWLGGLGVVLGAAGALLLTQVLQALLSDVRPTDPAVFAGTGTILLVVSVVACYLPARQASRTDPMVVLRAE